MYFLRVVNLFISRNYNVILKEKTICCKLLQIFVYYTWLSKVVVRVIKKKFFTVYYCMCSAVLATINLDILKQLEYDSIRYKLYMFGVQSSTVIT